MVTGGLDSWWTLGGHLCLGWYSQADAAGSSSGREAGASGDGLPGNPSERHPLNQRVRRCTAFFQFLLE